MLRIQTSALTRNSYGAGPRCEMLPHGHASADINRPSAREERVAANSEAWVEILRERNRGDNSTALAAAEHYAYARFDVSHGGLGAFLADIVSAPLYEGVKLFVPESWLRTGPGEVSPPSLESLASGLQGAVDGMRDYLDTSGDPREADERTQSEGAGDPPDGETRVVPHRPL